MHIGNNSIAKQDNASAKVKKESELIIPTLRKLMDRFKLGIQKCTRQNSSEQLIGPLSEILPVLDEASGLHWLGQIITVATLKDFRKRAKAAITQIEPISERL